MALKYEIHKMHTDDDDSSKTKVGFKVTSDSGSVLIIDKVITTGSKTAEQIVTEAQTASKSEIDAWVATQSNIGRVWDADNNKFV